MRTEWCLTAVRTWFQVPSELPVEDPSLSNGSPSLTNVCSFLVGFFFSFFFFQEIHQTFKYVSSLMVRENADSFPESYWSTCIVLPPSITVFTQFCCPDIITLLPRNLSNILAVCWLSGVDTILSKRLHIHQLVIQLFHPDSPSTCR